MKASIIESACRSVNHWNSKSHIVVTCINNFLLSHLQITWEENNAEIIFIAPLLHLFFLTFSFLFIMFSLCKDFSTLAFQSENPSTRKSIAFSLAVPVEDAMTREPRRRAMIVESDRGRSPTGTNSAVRDCSVSVVFFLPLWETLDCNASLSSSPSFSCRNRQYFFGRRVEFLSAQYIISRPF